MDTNKKEEEYSFIQEKIVPRTKNTKKRLVRCTCFTILLGVIFGVVSSLVYNVSNHLILKWNHSTEKEPILLEKEKQEEPEVSEQPDTSENPVQSEEPAKKLEDIDIYRAYDVKSYQKQYAVMRNVADKCRYSMVTVSAIEKVTGWFEMENSKTGYGLIIRNDENYVYILCNYEKIKGVKKIEVAFYNQESVRASFVTSNKESSLALLKIKSYVITERTRNKIEEIELGESFQSSAGVPVLGLGAPDGTLGSIAIGYITTPRIDQYIVDGKLGIYHTSIIENQYAEGFFVNLAGQVVGFITHHYKGKTDQNTMSFLGIARLKGIIQGMLNEKERAYLGIKVCELSSNDLKKLNAHYGIYVTDVIADSPAFKKGIRVGDVITEIDNVSISSVTALMEKLSEKESGDEIEIQVMRQTKVEYPKAMFVNRKITITLG